jgi:hypothetical protein
MMVLLKRDVPLIAIDREEFFLTEVAKEKYTQALQQVEGKRIFSLCLTSDLPLAEAALSRKAFSIKQVTPLVLPYYSQVIVWDISLIEVLPPNYREGRQEDSIPRPIPESGFRAEITVPRIPTAIHAGQQAGLRVRVKNVSGAEWPARVEGAGKFGISIGAKWLDPEGNALVEDDARGTFPHDLKPGDVVEINLTVNPPRRPGVYVLEIDAVQEHAQWFKEKGSTPYRLKLKVKP